MKQSTKVVLGVAVLAVVATAVVVFLASRSSSDADAAKGTTSVSSTPRPSGNQAHQVAVALGRLTTDPGSLVAAGSRDQVGQRARDGVPAGSSVEVDEASWAPDGVGGGTITATLRSPGLPPVTYAVVMVSEAGKWKVAATVPITDTETEPTR